LHPTVNTSLFGSCPVGVHLETCDPERTPHYFCLVNDKTNKSNIRANISHNPKASGENNWTDSTVCRVVTGFLILKLRMQSSRTKKKDVVRIPVSDNKFSHAHKSKTVIHSELQLCNFIRSTISIPHTNPKSPSSTRCCLRMAREMLSPINTGRECY